MKRNALFCLCLCLCVLFSACATPVPEDSSAPSEETGESNPVPEDENAKIVRAYLDELLEREWNAETETVTWIAPDRVETIRESVKNLKTPVLTEENVLALADRAIAMVAFLQRDPSRSLHLPSCGVMGEISWFSYAYYEEFYRALLGYTLYLFTPPEYVFREDEVGNQLGFPAGASLYFPLMGDYTTRREALALLQEGKNGVELPLYGFGPEEHPLNFNFCGVPFLLSREGDAMLLDLYDLAMKGEENGSYFEELREEFAEAEVQRWINFFSNPGVDSFGTYDAYRFPDGAQGYVFTLLAAGDVREIREAVERLSSPVLTITDVSDLERNLFLQVETNEPILLPGMDGETDIILWPDETDPVTLVHWVTVYFIHLFTPDAYRFERLLEIGTGYALREPGKAYESPEAAMEAFEQGLTRFACEVGGDPYFIDRDGNLEPPAEDPLYSTPY